MTTKHNPKFYTRSCSNCFRARARSIKINGEIVVVGVCGIVNGSGVFIRDIDWFETVQAYQRAQICDHFQGEYVPISINLSNLWEEVLDEIST